MACIYCITNKINGKMYIGQAKYFENRKQTHFYSMVTEQKDTRNYYMPIHASMRKYGVDNFSWKIIEDNISLEDIDMLEQLYIDMFDTYNLGYNSTYGGNSSYGYKHTAEVRKRMSELKKGKAPLKATTEAARKANIGRIQSVEEKEKRKRALNNPEVIAKREATRQKNKKMWKAVNQYTKEGEFVNSYDSLTLASKATGIHVSSICDVLKGRYYFARGFRWEYASKVFRKEVTY